MALAPIPTLPPTLRGADFISAFVSPAVPQSPVDTFNRIVATAHATDGPLPTQGLANAVGKTDLVSLLDQSLFRDLVTSFDGTTGVATQPDQTALFTALGVDGLLGNTGLPTALNGLSQGNAGILTASLADLFTTVQTLGGDSTTTTPSVGSLLDAIA